MAELHADVLILGAGLGGLSVAYHLQQQGISDFLVVEKGSLGGICGTKDVNGFLLDFGPHLFFTKDAYVVSLMERLLKGNLRTGRSDPWQYAYGAYGKYPYTTNMRYFPREIRERCLKDFHAAVKKKERDKEAGTAPKLATYPDWCRYHYGKGFADLFMLRYAKKYWTTDPSELNTEWIGDKIHLPTLEEVELGAAAEGGKHYYYDQFRYPERGGAEQLTKAFYDALPHQKVLPSCGVKRVDLQKKKVRLEDGREICFRMLINTIALPLFVKLIDGVPKNVLDAAAKLRATSVACFLVGVDAEDISDKAWIYFHEDELSFFRLSFPQHFSPHTCPPGCSSVWAEVAYKGKLDAEGMSKKVVADLKALGILKKEKVIATGFVDARLAYPIYDKERAPSLKVIKEFLSGKGVELAGRFGKWEYWWTHQVILDSKKVAEKVAGRVPGNAPA
ncbi:MAG: FAD-dependent oxidoreductase [Nanoarchaeota archaeon]